MCLVLEDMAGPPGGAELDLARGGSQSGGTRKDEHSTVLSPVASVYLARYPLCTYKRGPS